MANRNFMKDNFNNSPSIRKLRNRTIQATSTVTISPSTTTATANALITTPTNQISACSSVLNISNNNIELITSVTQEDEYDLESDFS